MTRRPEATHDILSLMGGAPDSDDLLAAALALAHAHDLDDVLGQIVEAGCQLLQTRYGALGIYDGAGTIQRFVHRGIDAETVEAIGRLPSGRGLLGELIVGEGPVRIAEITAHPRSCGFPQNQPELHDLLGTPIVVAGRRFGNLYLSEKTTGAGFDEVDETVVSTLAAFAACAIENALLIEAERERAATLGELAASQERERSQREVLAQIIRTQEAERARVARDLHDQVGQELTSVLLGLRVVESADTPQERAEAIDDVRGLVAEALQGIRHIAFTLRPTILDDLGLLHALQRLAEDTERRNGLRVEFDAGLPPDARLEPANETAIYRIVQEALTNVVRHASARNVMIRLAEDRGVVRAVVRDDGRGFDTSYNRESFGLRGMRERAQLVGGRVVIDSDRDGTTVIAEIPR